MNQGNAAHALPEPIVLLLSLRLECERREKGNLLTLSEATHDFGIIEIAGTEHDRGF